MRSKGGISLALSIGLRGRNRWFSRIRIVGHFWIEKVKEEWGSGRAQKDYKRV